MPTPSQSYTRNGLLKLCSASDYALLQPHLVRVHFSTKLPLYEPDEHIQWVYFPEGGIASVVARRESGAEVEVALFGREGMSSMSTILGIDKVPLRCFVQVNSATALRVPAEILMEACDRSLSLRKLLLAYVQCGIVQTAETAASNANNELPERLARWLLMCHDRIDGDDLPITHEYLAKMLAVRRSGVTVTLHTLEGSGAIQARRGLVRVRDRQRLIDIAGDSYGVPEAEYRRLIGPFGK